MFRTKSNWLIILIRDTTVDPGSTQLPWGTRKDFFHCQRTSCINCQHRALGMWLFIFFIFAFWVNSLDICLFSTYVTMSFFKMWIEDKACDWLLYTMHAHLNLFFLQFLAFKYIYIPLKEKKSTYKMNRRIMHIKTNLLHRTAK